MHHHPSTGVGGRAGTASSVLSVMKRLGSAVPSSQKRLLGRPRPDDPLPGQSPCKAQLQSKWCRARYLCGGSPAFRRQRAASAAAGPRTPPPAASPRTTETREAGGGSHRRHCRGAAELFPRPELELGGEHTAWGREQPEGVPRLTMSDSFILMVILLTASVALLNIFSIPAPLRVWVPTALGS